MKTHGSAPLRRLRSRRIRVNFCETGALFRSAGDGIVDRPLRRPLYPTAAMIANPTMATSVDTDRAEDT